MIKKKFIHFNEYATFTSKKLSASVENTTYSVGLEGEIQSGDPDIMYQSIVFIKDVKKIWTHGVIYEGNLDTLQEITTNIQTIFDDQEESSLVTAGALVDLNTKYEKAYNRAILNDISIDFGGTETEKTIAIMRTPCIISSIKSKNISSATIILENNTEKEIYLSSLFQNIDLGESDFVKFRITKTDESLASYLGITLKS